MVMFFLHLMQLLPEMIVFHLLMFPKFLQDSLMLSMCLSQSNLSLLSCLGRLCFCVLQHFGCQYSFLLQIALHTCAIN